jgi:hypothetical protein
MSLDIEKLRKLCEYARYHLGADCIIAGGAVRDTLHGRPVKDIDIFVKVSPDEVRAPVDFGGFRAFEANDTPFRQRCATLAKYFASLPGGENVSTGYQTHDKASAGELLDVVDITGTPYPVQIMALATDPVDDVQKYDFALSQCFVTPSGLFYAERYLGDANGLTVTYTGDAEIGSAGFSRSVKRYQRLHAKYAPEWRFENCEVLNKAIADSVL